MPTVTPARTAQSFGTPIFCRKRSVTASADLEKVNFSYSPLTAVSTTSKAVPSAGVRSSQRSAGVTAPGSGSQRRGHTAPGSGLSISHYSWLNTLMKDIVSILLLSAPSTLSPCRVWISPVAQRKTAGKSSRWWPRRSLRQRRRLRLTQAGPPLFQPPALQGWGETVEPRPFRCGCHLAMGRCLIRIFPSRTVTIAPRASSLPATEKTCFISDAI